MPDVGRFFGVDPLSEKYAYQSHCNFSENRVVNSREIEGLEAEDNHRDISKDLDVIWAREHQRADFRETNIEGIELTGMIDHSGKSVGLELPDLSDAPTIGSMPDTMGTMISDFRNSPAPESLGIIGDLGKGLIDGGLDAANYLRNINPFSDQRYYDGIGGAQMTDWDGFPLGGEEGLDRSMNGIMMFGSFLTGGVLSELNAAKGLGNPFKNSSLSEVDDAFQSYVKSGKLKHMFTNPKTGAKSYLNTKSGYSYNLDPGGMYGKKLELPHIDVNYSKPKPTFLDKKKLPVSGGF